MSKAPAKPKVPVYDSSGTFLEKIAVREEIIDHRPGDAVVHQNMRRILAGRRAGSASTKTRSEVRGGGRKPWRQKGTGRARAGSSRSPLWTGGGAVFGPKPKDWSIKLPAKARRVAMRQALTQRIIGERFFVLRDFELKEGRSREAKALLDALEVEGKALVVTSPDPLVARAFRNLRGVRVVQIDRLNAYDVLWSDHLLVSEPALGRLQEALS